MVRLALVVGVLVAAGSSAHGYVVQVDGPFDVLRDASRTWKFDLVSGPSLDQLTPVAKAGPIECSIEGVTSSTSKLVCRQVDTSAKAPPLAALVLGTRELAFEGDSVRELRGAATKEAIADQGNALALTFTGGAPASGRRSLQGPTGSKAELVSSTATYAIDGWTGPVYVTEATTTAAPTTGTPRPVPEQTAAIFAPSIGPVVMCRVRAKETPAYVCLRRAGATLATTPPTTVDPLTLDPGTAPTKKKTAVVTLVRKKTRLTTSLTPGAVAKKVASAYLAGIKSCYQTTLKSKPAGTGTLALVFTVNAVGKTEAIAAKSFDEKLSACVSAKLKTWRFEIPQSEYGSPIAAVYELDYKLALK